MTTTIPIVFGTGGDPIQQGLVTSLNRPGGNVTGVYFFLAAIESKRGTAARVGSKSRNDRGGGKSHLSECRGELKEVAEAAQTLGLKVFLVRASTDAEIDAAFAAMAEAKTGARWSAPTRSSSVAATDRRARRPARHSGNLRSAQICA